ncbi:hypothetical protein [Methylogaea oryzae]|nr:hypothetical protein [Methylogaea oryzae]
MAVEDQNVTTSEVDAIAALDHAHFLSNPKTLYASVATDRRVVDLIRHYISVNIAPSRQKICSTVAEAREWIAVAEVSQRLVFSAILQLHK